MLSPHQVYCQNEELSADQVTSQSGCSEDLLTSRQVRSLRHQGQAPLQAIRTDN